MKARKYLYLWSGILSCIYGSGIAFLSFLVLVLSKVVRKMFDSSVELVDEFINSLASSDSSYEYLLDFTHEQAVNYIMKLVYIMFIAFLIMGIMSIVFGVINIRIRNTENVFVGKLVTKIIFLVCTWIFTNIVCAILTTIAVFMKNRDQKIDDLYVSEGASHIN